PPVVQRPRHLHLAQPVRLVADFVLDAALVRPAALPVVTRHSLPRPYDFREYPGRYGACQAVFTSLGSGVWILVYDGLGTRSQPETRLQTPDSRNGLPDTGS